jgi:thioredoxin-like negative regulator of GroEL
MDFDYAWLLIAVPLLFALGWMASRLDMRQLRRDGREAPKAYFKGLTLLLNDQPDKAIDSFIEAVQHDPDTTELHFGLGNLFRRRGDVERAVRVHQHLLDRSDLSSADRQRAQHALAQDFMKAGLFDRAEQAYARLAPPSTTTRSSRCCRCTNARATGRRPRPSRASSSVVVPAPSPAASRTTNAKRRSRPTRRATASAPMRRSNAPSRPTRLPCGPGCWPGSGMPATRGMRRRWRSGTSCC